MPSLADISRGTFISALDEISRRELTAPAWHYFDRSDRKRLSELLTALDAAYQAYVDTKTNTAGNVVVAKRGDYSAAGQCMKGRNSLAPWNQRLRPTYNLGVRGTLCARRNRTSSKTLVRPFSAGRRSNQALSAWRVFSIELILCEKTAELQSLMRANSIVASLLAGAAKAWEESAHETAQYIDTTARNQHQHMHALSKRGVEVRQRDAVDKALRRMERRRSDMRHRRSIDLNPGALLAEREPELQPHLAMPPRIDATERFLLQLFLRRYVTWCARRRRFAAMNGAARLFREIRAR